MNKKNDILNLVNGIISDTERDEATKDFVKTVPSMVTMHKAIYEEMKKQKYNDEQSFKFASDYMLGLVFSVMQNRTEDDK